MKKRYVGLITLLFMIFVSLVSSSAYVELKHTVGNTVTYYPYEGFEVLYDNHMQNAASVWNKAVGREVISVSPTTQPNRLGYYKNDGKNYIYAEDVGAGYVAQNHYWWSGNKLTESDINLNMYYSWSNSAQSGRYDVYSVFLHELGHTIGLGDVEDDGYIDKSIMYQYVFKNKERRQLLSDDLAGVAALY